LDNEDGMARATVQQDWFDRQAQLMQDLQMWAYVTRRTRDDHEYNSLYLTHSRLQAVLYAADGVKHTAARIETLAKRMRGPGADKLTLSRKQVVSLDRRDMQHLARAARKAHEMTIELHNLIWWTRALLDRLDKDTQYQDPAAIEALVASGAPPDIKLYTGLMRFVPAAEAAGFQSQYSRFCSKWEQDIRQLANFSIHYSAASGNLSRWQITKQGLKVIMADRPQPKLSIFGELPINQKRDIAGYAQKLWPDVRDLVDSILTSFESAQAQRAAHGTKR
jgi:hypothetical protein